MYQVLEEHEPVIDACSERAATATRLAQRMLLGWISKKTDEND